MYREQMDKGAGILRNGVESEGSKQGETPVFKKAEAEKPERKLRYGQGSGRKIRLMRGERSKTKTKNKIKHFHRERMVSRVALATKSQATPVRRI